MDDDIAAVIIDNGSGTMKAGMAGDDTPRINFPTIIGEPKMPGIMVGMEQKDAFIGKEVLSKLDVLNVTHPIEFGLITDWEKMEKIWFHILINELHIDPEKNFLMMTDSPSNTKKARNEMAEIAFEKFGVKGLYIGIQAVLALLSSGRTTGVTLDSGYTVTHAVPIYEAYALPHAIQKINMGGKDLSEYLGKLMEEAGFSFSSSVEKTVIRDVKERHCYLAHDFEAEMKLYAESNEKFRNYKLPDGGTISIGNQRFKCPESIFQPIKIGKDYPGIHELVFQSIIKCDQDIRRDLYLNIILSGGNTMFNNIEEKMKKEVLALAPSSMIIKVVPPPERKYSAWLGGSILASMKSFEEMWVQKGDYFEDKSIIHKKCF